MANVIPTTNSQVNSAVVNSGAAGAGTTGGLADNFQSFLTLLTTQLKNQNPLDPLDTNQFTAQLVQFAQVEQQLKSNDQLSTLVSLQQTSQATSLLNFVGQNVGVSGATAPLSDGQAVWNLKVPKPVTGTITISSANGQTVYSGAYTMSAGTSPFVWDGKDSAGQQWPDGNYTISVTAQDAGGQLIAIPTEIEAVVDSADLTKNPPTLSIAGQDYTLDKITRIGRGG